MTFADAKVGDIVRLPDGRVVEVSTLTLARAAWYREVLSNGKRGELSPLPLDSEVAKYREVEVADGEG